jgi:hypothetical protein
MAYSTEAADAGWRLVYDELKRRDHKMVKDYREEVDTLLVFVRLQWFTVCENWIDDQFDRLVSSRPFSQHLS